MKRQMSTPDALRRLFSRPPRRVVAIDFELGHVRLALATISGQRAVVRRVATVDWPEDLDHGDAQAVGGFLGQTLKQKKLAGANLLMPVPRCDAVLRPIKLPASTPLEEMAAMVQFQAPKQLPIAAEQAVIDYTFASHFDAESVEGQDEAPAQVEVLVAAISQSRLKHYQQIAEAAGATLIGLGLRPYAGARALSDSRALAGVEHIALVQCLDAEMEIAVVVGGALTFSRSVRVAAPGDPSAAVREAARSLRGYMSVHPASQIDQIVVAGDIGDKQALAEKLGKTLDVPAHLFEGDALAPKARGPEPSGHITPLGLLSSYARGPFEIDFLHPKRPPKPPSKRPRHLAAIAAAVALVFGTFVGHHLLIDAKQGQLADLQAKYAGLKKQVKQVNLLSRHSREVQAWLNQKRDWLAHWARLSVLLPSADQAYIKAFRSTSHGGIAVDIQTRRTSDLTSLYDRLTRAGYDVKPGPIHAVSDRFGYRINAQMQIQLDPTVKVDVSKVQPPPRDPDDMAPAHFAKAFAHLRGHRDRRNHRGRLHHQ